MTVASLHATDSTMSWLGVGNVEGCLLRADRKLSHPFETVLLRSGVVGYQLPALHASVLSVAPGDLLLFATDGIRTGFTQRLSPGETPKQIAHRILAEYFRGTDDALVLAARFLGTA
jgi:hypothetical protein